MKHTNIKIRMMTYGALIAALYVALTYVAATAVALAQLLRLIMIFGNRRRRN